MKTLRLALTVLSVGLLVLGYGYSQLSYFRGEASSYARWIDQPPVQYGATALLLVCIVLSLVRDREPESDQN